MALPTANRFGIGISYVKGKDSYFAVGLYHSGVTTTHPSLPKPPSTKLNITLFFYYYFLEGTLVIPNKNFKKS